MARLPSSSDVPIVQQRRDPGLRVSGEAFQSPLGVAAEEFAPAVEKIRNIAVKQENRRDTVDRSSRINQYTLDADNELRRINAESDLSSEAVLQEYGKFLSERRNDLITEHGGSDDSSVMLNTRLMDVESRAIGQAGALSARLGREMVTNTFNDSLEPLIQAAALDPTVENIDEQLVAVETYLGDLKGAFDPTQEQSLRTAAKEQIALSALDSVISSGRPELAGFMLENRLFTELSPDSQRTVRNRIAGVKSARDQFDQEVGFIESKIGRSLNERELLSKFRISTSTEKLTERDRRRQRLIDRGYSDEFSDDLSSGDIEVKGPDSFGDYKRVNVVTGKSTPVNPEDAAAITAELEQAQPTEQPVKQPTEPRPTLEEAAAEATGPFAAAKTGISNIIGPFVEGELFKETASAKQKVRTFNQMAKTALVNNPKFPVAEQELVQRLLPDVDAFFLDPDRARSQVIELKDTLSEWYEAKGKELIESKTTLKRKGELTDQMSRINEILTLMTTEELPEGVPEGSTPAGTSKRGNPVWKTPDGKLLEAQ